MSARKLTIRENTLALAADLQFWLNTELEAASGDDHQYTRERIRMARADLSSAVLSDLRGTVADLLRERARKAS